MVVRDAVVDEKDDFALVPVLLGGPTGQASNWTVTVSYATSDGTAVAGVDYGSMSGQLTFAPGQTVKNVVVPIYDLGQKATKTFALTLGGATNASIVDGTGIVVIQANQAAPVALPTLPAVVRPPNVAVDEAIGYVDLPVTLSVPSVNPVTVSYSTGSNSASSGSTCPSGDYVSTSGTLTFAPGEVAKVVRVQVLDCSEVEGVETFRFVVSQPVNAVTPIVDPTTTISLVDNSTPWTPNNTTLPAVTGTAQPGQTLTASPGQWTGAPAAFQYSWQRCDNVGVNCSPITGATGTTYVTSAPDLGHRVRIEVTATNPIGTSLPAYSLPTTPILGIPTAPLNVTASAGNGLVYVSFTPPQSDGGGALTYTVTVSPGGATVQGASSPILVTGLTNGQAYTFTVRASNAAGAGPALGRIELGHAGQAPAPSAEPAGRVRRAGRPAVHAARGRAASEAAAPLSSPDRIRVTESRNALETRAFRCPCSAQGRQDSNLRHSVLETDALPAELRPSALARRF